MSEEIFEAILLELVEYTSLARLCQRTVTSEPRGSRCPVKVATMTLCKVRKKNAPLSTAAVGL